jgi:hypothetical protein
MAKKDSKEMLQNKIAALRKARSRIRGGIRHWICIALDDVGGQNPKLRNACTELIRYIAKALGRHSLLSDWVHSRPHKFYVSWDDMQRNRLQWIDWMIACLEEDLAEKA